jgi:hypothetical protein
MDYQVRTVFHPISHTENEYGETVETVLPGFVAGARPVTMSFKDQLQTDLKVTGDQQFIWTRKTPKTMTVKVGDRMILPSLSTRWFKIIAIDLMYANRDQLLFLVDALE